MLSKNFDIQKCKGDIITIMSRYPRGRWGLDNIRDDLQQRGYSLTNQQIGVICKRMEQEGMLTRSKWGKYGKTFVTLTKDYTVI